MDRREKGFSEMLGKLLCVIAIICTVLRLPPTNYVAAASNTWSIVYFVSGNQSSQIYIRNLDNSSEKMITIEGKISGALLNPNGKSLAFFTNNGQNWLANHGGRVGIVDLETQKITFLSVEMELMVEITYLYDEYTVKYRSLAWSPDGRYLAYNGRTSDHRLDAFIYDTSTQKLTNLSAGLAISNIDVASWSNDGKWLALVADFTGKTMEPVILSPDGATISRISPGQPTCRMIWSPDNRHLVSENHCYQSLGANTQLLLWTFDPDHPMKQSEPIHTISNKLQNGLDSWGYSVPQWNDNQTIVVIHIGCRTAAFNGDGAEKSQLVAYDLYKDEDFPIRLPRNSNKLNDWWILGDWIIIVTDEGSTFGYNPTHRMFVELTTVYGGCAIRYSTLSNDGKFAAIPTGCNSSNPDLFQVIDLSSKRAILSLDRGNVWTVGFIKSSN